MGHGLGLNWCCVCFYFELPDWVVEATSFPLPLVVGGVDISRVSLLPALFVGHLGLGRGMGRWLRGGNNLMCLM
jgi:hypothetical protein